MTRIVVITAADEHQATVDAFVEKLQASLDGARPAIPENRAAENAEELCPTLTTNERKVEALRHRAAQRGQTVLKKHVIYVAGIDESLFYKWQRGEYVSNNVRSSCEETVSLSAEEFLRRLNGSLE